MEDVADGVEELFEGVGGVGVVDEDADAGFVWNGFETAGNRSDLVKDRRNSSSRQKLCVSDEPKRSESGSRRALVSSLRCTLLTNDGGPEPSAEPALPSCLANSSNDLVSISTERGSGDQIRSRPSDAPGSLKSNRNAPASASRSNVCRPDRQHLIAAFKWFR